MFEAPALENTHQWHRSKQRIKTSHTPCRRTISQAPAPAACRRHRIRQPFKTNRSPLDTRFCKHAVYDNDDLTPCSINPWRVQRLPFPALFSGVRLRVYRSSSKSIRGKSISYRNAYRSFGRTDCFPAGSRGKCKTPAPASPPPVPGAWCLREGRVGAATYRSLSEAYTKTATVHGQVRKNRSRQIHKSIRCECEIVELSFRTQVCYTTTPNLGDAITPECLLS